MHAPRMIADERRFYLNDEMASARCVVYGCAAICLARTGAFRSENRLLSALRAWGRAQRGPNGSPFSMRESRAPRRLSRRLSREAPVLDGDKAPGIGDAPIEGWHAGRYALLAGPEMLSVVTASPLAWRADSSRIREAHPC
jgi:hypothetical protein